MSDVRRPRTVQFRKASGTATPDVAVLARELLQNGDEVASSSCESLSKLQDAVSEVTAKALPSMETHEYPLDDGSIQSFYELLPCTRGYD